MPKESSLHPVDYVILGLHFILTVGLGLFSTFRHTTSVKNYFLAGRRMNWFLVGSSLFMSNIGSSSFLGLSGAAAASGISVICYEWTGLLCILLLGYLFMPVYLSAGVFTMPEYLKLRFGGSRLQLYLAIQSLILFVLTRLSVELYSGVIIIEVMLGWNRYIAVMALLVATMFYTILGGLTAVIYTDALQAIVVLVSATVLAVISMVKVGGYEAMQSSYTSSIASSVLLSNSSCGLTNPDSFHILKDAKDKDYPWPGVLFGSTLLSAWYFCTDQVLVQRILSAKNLSHAKAGTVFAALLKITPFFLMLWPGMVSRILYPDEVGCADPQTCKNLCQNPGGCSNYAYPLLVMNLMPVALRGLMLAAMLAALMSSLTSIFNSGSTVFTIDIWKRLRKNPSAREQLIVGKCFVILFVGISILLIPMMDSAEGGQIFHYLQAIGSYLAPPIFSCYLLAITCPRVNESGAFYGLLTGFVFGITRMVASFVYTAPACGQSDFRPSIIKDFHYLHYAIFLFLLSGAVTIAVSILTKYQTTEELRGLTIWTLAPTTSVGSSQNSYTDDEAKQHFNQESRSWKHRITAVLCDIDTTDDGDHPTNEDVQPASLPVEINKRWQPIIDILAVLSATLGIFIYAFFA